MTARGRSILPVPFRLSFFLPAFFLLVLAACAPRVPEDRVTLEPASFAELPGWQGDDARGALAALKRSCDRHLARPANAPVGPSGVAGTAGDWHGACRMLATLDTARMSADDARRFVEANFRPWRVYGADGDSGLFTGYYEASARGSRVRSARYNVPLHARPADLVTADLSLFSEEFRGRSIAGRVRGGRFVPYDDRAKIASGALNGRGLEIVWVDDPVDAFFMEVQGSGRIFMEDGSVLRVGFAGKNGLPYTSIGRVLIDMGEIPREQVSMQSIRAWLAANPAKAREVMEKNRSYVFFRTLDGDGPIGAEGVALTPGRSLAVDRRFFGLGVPFYLAADDEAGALAPVRALVVAQDTGGAIRGPVRGDVFLGWGDDAAERAGRMKMRGRYWMLLPRAARSGLTASVS